MKLVSKQNLHNIILRIFAGKLLSRC